MTCNTTSLLDLVTFIFATAAVTNDPSTPTVVAGGAAVSPGTSYTGWNNSVAVGGGGGGIGYVSGPTYIGTGANASAVGAQMQAVYTYISTLTPTSVLGGSVTNEVITPGVYDVSSSFLMNSPGVTFDFQNNPDAFIVIRIGTTLTTAANVVANLVNGADPARIIFTLGAAATFGTTGVFYGSVLAGSSISFTEGGTHTGRLAALSGTLSFAGTTPINVHANVPKVCNETATVSSSGMAAPSSSGT